MLMQMADRYSRYAEAAFQATEDLQSCAAKVRATGLMFRAPLDKVKQFDKGLKRFTEHPAFKNFQKYAAIKGHASTVFGLGNRLATTLKNPNLPPGVRNSLVALQSLGAGLEQLGNIRLAGHMFEGYEQILSGLTDTMNNLAGKATITTKEGVFSAAEEQSVLKGLDRTHQYVKTPFWHRGIPLVQEYPFAAGKERYYLQMPSGTWIGVPDYDAVASIAADYYLTTKKNSDAQTLWRIFNDPEEQDSLRFRAELELEIRKAEEVLGDLPGVDRRTRYRLYSETRERIQRWHKALGLPLEHGALDRLIRIEVANPGGVVRALRARVLRAYPGFAEYLASLDEGLRQVKKLRALETLTLAETDVSDEGLAELIGLKSLRTFDARGSKVTAAGATVLRRFLPEVEVSFGPMPGGAEPDGQPGAGPADAAPPVQSGPAQGKVALPSAAKIKELRHKVMELILPDEDADEPEGWSKSWHDSIKVVELFRPLRVKKDYVLRAYLHREGGNGFGVVWALPADVEYPEPKDCPRLGHHFLRVPKPWDALDDTMEAFEGDDSEWSYLAASLLRRELGEFGSLWHGIQWGTHTLLDDSPWAGGPPPKDAFPGERPDSQPHEWKWFEAQPDHWAPQVRLEPDRAIVTFYTYTAHAGGGDDDDGKMDRERIIRHTDTYRRGKYRSMTVEKKFAEGPNALVF